MNIILTIVMLICHQEFTGYVHHVCDKMRQYTETLFLLSACLCEKASLCQDIPRVGPVKKIMSQCTDTILSQTWRCICYVLWWQINITIVSMMFITFCVVMLTSLPILLSYRYYLSMTPQSFYINFLKVNFIKF